MATTSTLYQRHWLTVADYHRMGEAGIFSEDDRIELIEGEIIDMPPIGSKHAALVSRLQRLLERRGGDQAIVWTQNPIELGEQSEPQPDLCLLRPREDFYAPAHPQPEDVLLLIEVADTTLRYDQEVKLPLYARHRIPEVWIVDLENRCLRVFRLPTRSVYKDCQTVDGPTVITLLALPERTVNLAGLF